jgi:hypothetical protein
MISRNVQRPIVRDHLIHLRACSFWKEILKQIVQMTPDIEPQELIGDIAPRCAREDTLNRAANVSRGVEQSPVHVEQVDRELRDQVLSGLRPFAAEQSGARKLATLRTNHLLLFAVTGRHRLGTHRRCQRLALDQQPNFGAVQDFALE